MSLETLIRIARRMRELTDEEFEALEELVLHQTAREDGRLLGPALDALGDCAELTREDD